jgi:hypothetical protein
VPSIERCLVGGKKRMKNSVVLFTVLLCDTLRSLVLRNNKIEALVNNGCASHAGVFYLR